MTATALTAIALVWPVAADPIPKQDAQPATVQISGLEKGTLKLTYKKGDTFQYSAVMTADGPRIRVETDSLVLEASRLEMQYGDMLTGMTAVALEGGKPVIELTIKVLPARAPMPKPK